MLGLTIETSTSSGLILLSDQEHSLSHKIVDASFNLSKELLPSIQIILEENRLSPKHLRYVACGFGPGSYTGTRLGATVAKSLSFALGIPLLGFCSALAFLPPSTTGRFIYLCDAKMGQLCIIKGYRDSSGAYADHSLLLIEPRELADHCTEIDFIVSTLSFPLSRPIYQPMPNPSLLASLVYKKFINHEYCLENEPTLLYYR